MERRLPARVGHEPPDDAHAGRPLHDRGPLPRPEGGRRQPRLRGAHEVRRPLAGRPPGHGRRSGDGDGPCHPARVLGRPRRAVLPRLRPPVHRHAAARHPAGARRRPRRRSLPDGVRPRGRRRERRLEDRRPRRGDRCAGRAERLRGLPLGRGEGPLEPGARRHQAGAHAARPRRCRGRRRRHAPVRRGRDRRRLVGAAGRPRDAGGRPSRHHRARPHAGPVRRRPRRPPRRVARADTTTPARPARPPGRSSSRRSRPSTACGPPASSRGTPSRPRAAP